MERAGLPCAGASPGPDRPSDPARRVRAHLLWSLNPLMLLALHGQRAQRRPRRRRWGIRAFRPAPGQFPPRPAGRAPARARRRDQSAIRALRRGPGLDRPALQTRPRQPWPSSAAAILIPSYLLAGRAAISATLRPEPSVPAQPGLWSDVAKVLGWQQQIVRTNTLA